MITGCFKVKDVSIGPVDQIWRIARDTAFVTEDEFHAYYAGTSMGVAISVADTMRFHNPLLINDIGTATRKVKPPQSYRYLTNADIPQMSALVAT